VTEGEHVTSGQLLAEVDPTSAEVEPEVRGDQPDPTRRRNTKPRSKASRPQNCIRANSAPGRGARRSATAERSERQAEQTRSSDEAASRNSVAQAELALRRAEQSAGIDATSQQDAINQAISQRTADQRTLAEARAQPNGLTIASTKRR